MRRTLILVYLAVGLSPARAQNINGSIFGTVTDRSGASVNNAEITITNQGTNRSEHVTSSNGGHYGAPQLAPGTYSIKAGLAGFKTVVRPNIELAVESNLRIDFALELGDTATSITVTAEAPMVESGSGSQGLVVSGKEIEELPIKGRNVFDLALLTPGVAVNPLALGAVASTGDNTAPLFVMSDISINGGRFRTNDYLLDGVSIMLPANNYFAIAPSPDATQEFKVMTNAYGPQFGRSGGGVLNVVTKSGTNMVHGSLYEFFRNDWFKANNFFANASGQPQGPQHYNLFGGAAGAPIVKNKTFFFVEYWGLRSSSSTGGQFVTVPTAAERTGDFSHILNTNGQQVNVFNPYQTVVTGGTTLRVQFPNNQIPQSIMDPVALKMTGYIPLPNRAGSIAGANNFVWQQQAFINSDQFSVRIDHHFSDRQTLFGRFSHNDGNSANTGPFNDAADNTLGIDVSHAINSVLNYTFLLSSSAILNVRAGVTRRFEGRVPLHGAVGLANLGFPASFATQTEGQFFPAINFTGYSAWGDPSGDPIRCGNDIYTLVADETLIHGRHTMVFGTDIRLYDTTPYQAGPDSGTFSFTSGDAFASFLTGYGSGSVTNTPALAIRNMYYALYFNDSIRLGKLTITAGLRWEYPQPPTERYNRFATFDPSAPFPIQIPGLPNLTGVMEHPGQDGAPRGQYDSYYKDFGPRFGLAYSLTPKTVIRSGYGIFYAPRFGTTSATGYGTSGALTTTTWAVSANGVSLAYPLSNPFPNGLNTSGPAPNLATYVQLGQSISVTGKNSISDTYNQQWNFNIQHQFGNSYLVEVGYSGNKGTHLPVALLLDQLNPIYQSLGTGLNKTVPNPFYGIVTTGTLSLPTWSYAQLLRPYPQYTGVSTAGSAATMENIGDSNYQALQIKAQKRFSRGVSFVLSYVKAKLIDDASGRVFGVNTFVPPVQNIYNLRAERSISEGDVPQQLVFTHTIELPVGRGRMLLANASKPVEFLLGGWSVQGTATFSSGMPLVPTMSSNNAGVSDAIVRPNNDGTSAKLSGPVESRLNEYFNTSVFSVPPAYTFGNTARTLPDTRNPGRSNYDMNLSKKWIVREGWSLNLRAEAYNLANSPYFLGPGTSLGASTFGVISVTRGERQIQFALKLMF
jgi:hypothetical protein